jgi:hypothetical protein
MKRKLFSILVVVSLFCTLVIGNTAHAAMRNLNKRYLLVKVSDNPLQLDESVYSTLSYLE